MNVLLVTGSRDWTDNLAISNYMSALAAEGWLGRQNSLINGYARGVDQAVRTQAIMLGWQVKDFHPRDYQSRGMSYGRACNVRNEAMVRVLHYYRTDGHVTRSVAFWRAHSTGTGNTLRMLNTSGFEPKIFYDCPCHS